MTLTYPLQRETRGLNVFELFKLYFHIIPFLLMFAYYFEINIVI